MIILSKDYKNGFVKLSPENADDLWYLSSIIEIGDEISGTTLRKISVSGGSDDRSKSAVRKPMFIKIKAEKIEFSKHLQSLRILGPIIDGPEDLPRGEYHSFAISPGEKFNLNKHKIYKYQIDKIEDSTNTNLPSIILCVFDREHAILAILKRQEYEILTELKGNVEKKNYEQKGTDFYKEIEKVMQDYNKKYEPLTIIIASPAFFKEDFVKKVEDDLLKKKFVLSTVHSVTKNALNELLKRPELKEVLKQGRAAKELGLVEELLFEISKDAAAVYGIKQTREASEAGAIQTLLITDNYIQKMREENKFHGVEKIMRTVDESSGKIHIINSENEGGEKLDGLGGIAAILRYKINY